MDLCLPMPQSRLTRVSKTKKYTSVSKVCIGVGKPGKVIYDKLE